MRFMHLIAAAWPPRISAHAQTPVQRGGYLVNGILDLRQLPHPAWSRRRVRHGEATLRRTADLGRADLHGEGLQHHARPGDRHRHLDRRARSSAPSQDGVRPNGVPLAPHMPYAFYKIFTPADLNAVVAYLQSVPAMRNEVAPPVYKAPMPRRTAGRARSRSPRPTCAIR